jgi:hypothetical protein
MRIVPPLAGDPERRLTFRQADRTREDFAAILDELDFMKGRLSRLPTTIVSQPPAPGDRILTIAEADRVLARYSKGTRAGKTASASGPTTSTKAAASAQSRGRPRARAAKPVSGKRGALSLNDQALALATGKTQQEITAGCKGARPNHVGMALAKRAGRIEHRHARAPLRPAASLWSIAPDRRSAGGLLPLDDP